MKNKNGKMKNVKRKNEKGKIKNEKKMERWCPFFIIKIEICFFKPFIVLSNECLHKF